MDLGDHRPVAHVPHGESFPDPSRGAPRGGPQLGGCRRKFFRGLAVSMAVYQQVVKADVRILVTQPDCDA